jgi:26S proteasome regulatory subunit N6
MVKYAQLRAESMRAIGRAHQHRNLADFEKALRDYKDGKFFVLLVFPMVYSSNYYIFIELVLDPTIRSHLAALYNSLLE